MSRSVLVPLLMAPGTTVGWATADQLSEGNLNLYGAAPYSGVVRLFQASTKVGQLQAFSDMRLVSYAPCNNLRLEAPGEISFWPGATADPATYKAMSINAPGATVVSIIPASGQTAWNLLGFNKSDGSGRGAFFGLNNNLDAILGSDAGDLVFRNGSTNVGKFDSGGYFLVAKTASGINNVGVQVAPSGQVGSTLSTDVPHYICNATGAAVASGHNFIDFRNNNSVIGSITRNAATSAVLYNTTSDYRLKQDCGRITQARERIKVLQPRRFTWKDDPTEQVQDGFFAHEVVDAVPEAITGVKDGEKMQMIDQSKLIPLLVAAVQELTTEVETLKARIAQLEAA